MAEPVPAGSAAAAGTCRRLKQFALPAGVTASFGPGNPRARQRALMLAGKAATTPDPPN